ncbi:MAG: PspC domain-containing protein [Ferruginibacter sp.]|nr:PspC domain-containing protein [Ferruginibacter sp.]
MKQVININFQGRVVPIEVTAFELLKNYTESLNRHFANEEGKDEIINDIESRIGELFQERIKNGATCITDDDVNAIIKSMGRPEEFADIEDASTNTSSNTNTQQDQTNSSSSTHTQPTGSRRLYRDEENKILGGVCAGIGNYFGIDAWIPRILLIITGVGFIAYFILWAFLPSSTTKVIGGVRKKLYRDSDDKIIAGVCSGIGNYFGINAWIPRVLFLLPFISFVFNNGHWDGLFDFGHFMRVSFSPGSLIIYIILWLVIPEATTTAEKLEMKGEKVDIDSIKNSVMEEMKGVQSRAEKFGKEATAFATSSAQKVSSEVSGIAKRNRSGLGDVIAIIFKAFAYFIIGSIGIAVLVGLFAASIASVGLLPLKEFVVRDGWQNVLAWGTLIFFILLPLIGAITWIIRRIAKTKANSKIIRWGFIAGWTLGWVCFFAFWSVLFRDFKYQNKVEESVYLSNPTVKSLELSGTSVTDKYYGKRWLKIEPYNLINEDSALVPNIQVRIKKSSNDSFSVVMNRVSNGNTTSQARALAEKININLTQKDSLLIADKGFVINKTDKFRNQHIILTVYVPVGKKIKINKNFGGWNNVEFDGPWIDDASQRDWDDDYDSYQHNWGKGKTYIMREDGLYNLDGEPTNGNRSNGKTKVSIGPGGIIVKDGNTDVNIGPDGIRVEEGGSDNYRYNNNTTTNTTINLNSQDSIARQKEIEKARLKDSLLRIKERNSKLNEEVDKQIEKLNGSVLKTEINDVALFIPVNTFFLMPSTFN